MELKKHRILIAAGVLLALVGTLAFLERQRNAEFQAGAEGEESPLPTLVRDQITSIEIRRPNSEAVRLEKRGDSFRVAAPLDYPADTSNVNAMLDKLVELEFVSFASRSRGSHAELEVDDAHAIVVVVKAGSREVATLRIGAYRGTNTMVRLGNSNDVVAVRGSIRYAFARELKEWRNRVITEASPADVKWVSFASDQGNFRFERNAEGDFAPAAGQAAIAEFDASRVDGLVSSLSRLRAVDFGADASAAGFETPRGVVTLHLETGAGPDGGTPRVEDIVLTLGAAHGESGDAFVRRAGNDTVYVVASASVEKLRPAPTAFRAPPPGEAPPDPHGMPGEMPGGPGGQQIPPEVLRQLMQQAGGHP